MTEPITPTGKRLLEYLRTYPRGLDSYPDMVLAIEREARAMALHEACEAEWKLRDARHPGIDQTLHDWRAHLE